VLLAEAVIKHRDIRATRLLLPMSAVAVAIVLSAAVNESSLLGTVSSLVLYLRYPLLFIALVNARVTLKQGWHLAIAVCLLAAIQVPEIAIRYALYGTQGDTVSWSAGTWGTYPLTVVGVYAMCIVAAHATFSRFRWYHLALLLSLMATAAVAEAKALVVLGPLCAFIVLLAPSPSSVRGLSRSVALMAFAVAATAVLLGWTLVWSAESSDMSPIVEQARSVIREPLSLDSYQYVVRTRSTIDAVSQLAARRGILFGAGPGSSLAGNALGETGSLRTGSEGQVTQLSASIWDFGVLGLVAYFWMLASTLPLIRAGIARLRAGIGAMLASSMIGMWVFYAAVGPVYNLIWRHDVASLPFWGILAAIAVAVTEWPASNDNGHQLPSA
jgi:hypothetical protein